LYLDSNKNKDDDEYNEDDEGSPKKTKKEDKVKISLFIKFRMIHMLSI